MRINQRKQRALEPLRFLARQRPVARLADLARVRSVAHPHEAAHRCAGVAAKALQFTILCATRTSETLDMTWDEV
jgi:hypothetical protein